MFKITPALAGFVKGLGTVVIFAVLSYLADANNLSALVGTGGAGLIATVVAQFETILKAKSNGERGLFGSVAIKK